MFMHRTLSVIFFVLATHGVCVAKDVFLQLEEFQADANAEQGREKVVRVLEANVSLGTPFYLRSVANGQQWLLRGTVTQLPTGGYRVQYQFATTELREDPSPRVELEGSLEAQFWRTYSLGRAGTEAETGYNLALYAFNPLLGFRGTSSAFSVRLVDEAGQPIPNAEVTLYGPVSGSNWERIIGPVKSDAEGIARFSEGRESLPEFTLVAEHNNRSLVAVAHLDRNNVSDRLSTDPQSITMRRELKRWKRPPQTDAPE